MAGSGRVQSCVINVCRIRTSNRQSHQSDPGVVKEKKNTRRGVFPGCVSWSQDSFMSTADYCTGFHRRAAGRTRSWYG
jgi:tRNA A37 methylthiotransferase MiaB